MSLLFVTYCCCSGLYPLLFITISCARWRPVTSCASLQSRVRHPAHPSPTPLPRWRVLQSLQPPLTLLMPLISLRKHQVIKMGQQVRAVG